MIFKRLTDNQDINLAKYAKKILNEKSKTTIYIGCDSQQVRNKTVYATVVVFRYKNGAHITYKREYEPNIKDIWPRLWKEVEKSVSVAEYLRINGGIMATQIDLDYNEDPKYPSNRLVKAAVGYVESLGYKAKAKPGLLIATYAADGICR